MSSELDVIPELEPLLDLARDQLDDAPPRRDPASLMVVRRRVDQLRSVTRRRGDSWFMLAPIAAGMAAALVYFMSSAPAPLDMEVLAGELSSIGEVRPSLDTTTIRFSDGTRVEVDATARARVTTVSDRGADLELEHGQISLDVTKRPGASWNVLAGAYRVHVTGTSFAVAFDEAKQTFGVRMYSGSVRVTGPLLNQGVDVSRGETLSVDVDRGSVRIQPLETASVAEVAPAEPELDIPSLEFDELEPSPDMSGEAAAPRTPQRAHARASTPPSWQSQVASGHFAAVLEQAERRGLQDVYQTASLDDLDALSDAARYARKKTTAREALLAIRKRFGATRLAREAAFLLGRLLEASEAPAPAALEWYQRYLDEDAKGVYATQALGRKMLLVRRQHGSSAALPIARDYLQQFPAGPYASSARKLVAGR